MTRTTVHVGRRRARSRARRRSYSRAADPPAPTSTASAGPAPRLEQSVGRSFEGLIGELARSPRTRTSTTARAEYAPGLFDGLWVGSKRQATGVRSAMRSGGTVGQVGRTPRPLQAVWGSQLFRRRRSRRSRRGSLEGGHRSRSSTIGIGPRPHGSFIEGHPAPRSHGVAGDLTRGHVDSPPAPVRTRPQPSREGNAPFGGGASGGKQPSEPGLPKKIPWRRKVFAELGEEPPQGTHWGSVGNFPGKLAGKSMSQPSPRGSDETTRVTASPRRGAGGGGRRAPRRRRTRRRPRARAPRAPLSSCRC